jgi:uncharacterized protein
MKIIDCNACIGLGTVNRMIVNHETLLVYEKIRQARNAEELLKDMDFCGIEQSFVYHQAMFDTDPIYGNQLIVEEAAKAPERIQVTWTILPPITEDFFAPERLIPEMKRHHIRALRAFPHRNRYFLDRVTMGDLLTTLCERNIPLFLTPYEEWQFIFTVLAEFPKLTVIIANYGLWGSDRYFYPLINTYENVYIDTSDYQVLGGFQAFVKKFGSDRLLFGSNYPMDNIGGALATLLGSGIPHADIEKIAHVNIESLMGRVAL